MVIVYVYKTIQEAPRLKAYTWFSFLLTFLRSVTKRWK